MAVYFVSASVFLPLETSWLVILVLFGPTPCILQLVFFKLIRFLLFFRQWKAKT